MAQPKFRTIPKQAPTLMESLVQTQERVTNFEDGVMVLCLLLNQTVKRVVDLEARVQDIEESRESEYDMNRIEPEAY